MTEPGLLQSTVLRWRDGSAGTEPERRTTIVAKMAARWVPGGRATLIPPEPLVPYDERAVDPLRVERAGELAPILPCAAVLISGGTARVTVAGPLGARVIQPSRAAGVGVSMASPERGRFAPTAPTRGDDGLLVIPGELDARFFHAAPEQQHLPLLRGSEPITIETAQGRVDTSLPGIVAVATVRGERGEERRLVLGLDMVVVDLLRAQFSLVGRASVRGAFELVGLGLAAIEGAGTTDRGDPRKHRPDSRARIEAVPNVALGLSETAPISSATIAQVRARAATPFQSTDPPTTLMRNPSPTGRPAGSQPATPFEGFRPAKVLPAAGLDRTFTDAPALQTMPHAVLPPGPAGAQIEEESTTISEPGVAQALPFGLGSGPAPPQLVVQPSAATPFTAPPAMVAPPAIVGAPAITPPPPPAPAPAPAPTRAPTPVVASPPPGPMQPVAPAAAVGASGASEGAARDPRVVAALARHAAGERLDGLDLQGLDLRGLTFARASFADAKLARADFRGANLTECRFVRAQLEGADLRGAKLGGADLSEAMMARAELADASFDDATLDRASLDGARAKGARFVRVKARGTRFFATDLAGADFTDADLSGASIERATLTTAKLVGIVAPDLTAREADLTGANLDGATLARADFAGAILNDASARRVQATKASFEKAQLARVDLTQAQLSESRLARAQLEEAKLDGAQLAKSDLRSAVLSSAHLDGAHLEGVRGRELRASGASLRGAFLAGADLERAELEGATLDDADLDGAMMRGAKLAGASVRAAKLGRVDLRDADLSAADFTDTDAASAKMRGARLRDTKGIASTPKDA